MANPSASNLSVASGAKIGGVQILVGTGAPTATAAKGSLYIRTDGTTSATRLYINTNGGTTYTPVTTTA